MDYSSNFGNTLRFSFEIDPRKPNELRIVNTVRLHKNALRGYKSFIGRPVFQRKFKAINLRTGEQIPCVTLIGNFGCMGTFLDTTIEKIDPPSQKIAFRPMKIKNGHKVPIFN